MGESAGRNSQIVERLGSLLQDAAECVKYEDSEAQDIFQGFSETFKHFSPKTAAAAALSKMPRAISDKPEILRCLVSLLDDKNPFARQMAMRALTAVGNSAPQIQALVERFVELLSDDEQCAVVTFNVPLQSRSRVCDEAVQALSQMPKIVSQSQGALTRALALLEGDGHQRTVASRLLQGFASQGWHCYRRLDRNVVAVNVLA
jgi:hypothetical protein